MSWFAGKLPQGHRDVLEKSRLHPAEGPSDTSSQVPSTFPL